MSSFGDLQGHVQWRCLDRLLLREVDSLKLTGGLVVETVLVKTEMFKITFLSICGNSLGILYVNL